jgi:uncharacterized protein
VSNTHHEYSLGMAERPEPDTGRLERAGQQLEQFAAGLSASQQAALQALLARAAQAQPGAALAAEPPESVLSAAENDIFAQVRAVPLPRHGAGRPTLTMIMKATRLCNLRCTYCHSWRDGPNQVMTFLTLARAIRDALRDPDVYLVDFVWHGGEATLLPLAFYRKALWLQEQFRRPDQTVINSLQTNGTRLTDEWISFLHYYRFGVGISLDGPPEIHDLRRVDVGGHPTAARVRAGLERLQASGIRKTGILLVVDDEVVRLGARRVLEYLLEIGVDAVALLNVIPENAPHDAPAGGAYLPLPRYVQFLRDLFHLWWPEHVGRLRVRELATLAAQLRGEAPQICIFAGDCFGGYLTVEPDGNVSACDKYIGDQEYQFGSLIASDLIEIQGAPQLATVRSENRRAVERMRDCPWFTVCRGGCPHDRYTGERRLPGYAGRCCGFAPLLEEMATAIRAADQTVSDPSTPAIGGTGVLA